jgi:metallo-beta-lactamase family protein
MAAAATTAYANRTEEQDEDYASVLAKQERPLRTHSMMTCSSREESKRLNDAQGARVIISASGMMTGGRVLHHALRLLPEAPATIVFVGYQAAGTLGRRILNGETEVKILGQWVPVRCKIERIGGFSAHADWKEILHWLEGMPSAPRRTFLTHGEPNAANAMAGHISDRLGWVVEVPTYGEKYLLE